MGVCRILRRNSVWCMVTSISLFSFTGCGAANGTEESDELGAGDPLGQTQAELAFNRCRTLSLANGSVKYSTGLHAVG
jgi:hypothetical protein